MIETLIAVTSGIYAIIAYLYYQELNYGYSVAFLAYSIANLALYASAKGW